MFSTELVRTLSVVGDWPKCNSNQLQPKRESIYQFIHLEIQGIRCWIHVANDVYIMPSVSSSLGSCCSVMASLISPQVPKEPAVPHLFLLFVTFKGKRDPLLPNTFSRNPRVIGLSWAPIPELVPAPGGWNMLMRPTPGPNMWAALPAGH